MEKLVIDRTKWGRGSTGGMLLDPVTGMMCCLGFESLRCGVRLGQMSNVSMPKGIEGFSFSTWMIYSVAGANGEMLMNSADADIAANINDARDTPDEFKESEIKKIFARHDVEVEFIN